MAQSIDFYIDVTSGQLVAAGSSYLGAIPSLTRNDSYTFRLRLQERDSVGILKDISSTGIAAKLGIGGVDDGPSDGQFKLTLGATTSSAISYNATTAQFLNSISAIAPGASVSTYGNDPYSYLITSATANTAMSFGGDSFTLFPTSSVLVSTRRFPKANVSAQQIIQLRRNPAVYADTFVASPTSGVVSLAKIQDGGTDKNESYLLTIGKDAIGGGVVLNYGSNSTTAIPVGSNSASFAEALQSVTGIGVGNISVDSASNSSEYTISFVKQLGNINVTTSLTLDSSGVVFANFIQSTVTMATAELDELFAESGSDTITPTLEIEITENGKTSTIYQSSISIRRDLITTGSVVPAAQASYYTKSESDSKFVEEATTGAAGSINAANWKLEDSSGNDSLDWQNRKLFNGSSERISWSSGLGFFGTTAISKPSGSNLINSVSSLGLISYSAPTQENVISNLVSCGLLSSSSTYGILPTSVKTLTTTASIWFGGAIAANDVHSISIGLTGASLNDIVLFGLPSAVCQGLTFQGCVVSANVVSIIAQNGTNSSQNQATATYRITVIGY